MYDFLYNSNIHVTRKPDLIDAIRYRIRIQTFTTLKRQSFYDN